MSAPSRELRRPARFQRTIGSALNAQARRAVVRLLGAVLRLPEAAARLRTFSMIARRLIGATLGRASATAQGVANPDRGIGDAVRAEGLLDDDRGRKVGGGTVWEHDVAFDDVRPWGQRVREVNKAVGDGQPMPFCPLQPEDVVLRQMDLQ